jgi:hypothetical protein
MAGQLELLKMSLGDISTRDRNALSPVIQPAVISAGVDIVPPFDATTSSFTLKATNFNLLGPVIGAGGANSLVFTGTNGGAFSVPVGKNVIVKTLYIRLTGLALTGTYFGYNWTAPTVRCYRSGTTTTVSNTFVFTSGTIAAPLSIYASTDHFGWFSTPAGGRRTLLVGESLALGILVAYSAGTSGFSYTTLQGDAYAECLLVNA